MLKWTFRLLLGCYTSASVSPSLFLSPPCQMSLFIRIYTAMFLILDPGKWHPCSWLPSCDVCALIVLFPFYVLYHKNWIGTMIWMTPCTYKSTRILLMKMTPVYFSWNEAYGVIGCIPIDIYLEWSLLWLRGTIFKHIFISLCIPSTNN